MYTRCSFATFLKCLLLVVVGSLGSCQRAAYQFQNPVAAYPLPRVAPGTSAVVSLPTRYALAAPLRAPSRARHLGRTARALPLHMPLARAGKQLTAAKLHLGPAAAKAPRVVVAEKQSQEPLPTAPVRGRSRGIALVLALLLGSFGAHLFYLGYYRRAVLYLLLSAASIVLLGVAAALFIAALFSSSAAGFVAFGILALALASVVGVLSLVDVVLILTGELKPKDGEYYPRFFQTRPKP